MRKITQNIKIQFAKALIEAIAEFTLKYYRDQRKELPENLEIYVGLGSPRG